MKFKNNANGLRFDFLGLLELDRLDFPLLFVLSFEDFPKILFKIKNYAMIGLYLYYVVF